MTLGKKYVYKLSFRPKQISCPKIVNVTRLPVNIRSLLFTGQNVSITSAGYKIRTKNFETMALNFYLSARNDNQDDNKYFTLTSECSVKLISQRLNY